MRRLYTKEEAIVLYIWANALFEEALRKSSSERWPYTALFTARQNGKTRMIYENLERGAYEYLNETLTPYQKWLYKLSHDYSLILMKDEEDEGGFESMAEAYAAGVPLEDILA